MFEFDETFIKTLCGHYSNKNQSNMHPRLYAHINIYFRLLPWSILKGISITTGPGLPEFAI